MTRDLHQEVTDSIVTAIEAGAGKWEMPWHVASDGLPVNATTGAQYHGVNILTLWARAARAGYPTAQWATYQQWLAIGAQVKAGEKGSMIVYAGTFTPKDARAESRTESSDPAKPMHFLKCSAVFNSAQVTGFDAVAPIRPCLAERITAADAFVSATKADIRFGNARAFYAPELDYIGVPDFDAFTPTVSSTATENAYSTLLHELTHWTGHQSRCARDFGKRFGNDAYAAEELVAELGAAFLCADLAITNLPRVDHAQYLAHWLRVLKADKRAIFTAASAATRAVAYLHNPLAHKMAVAA